MRNALLVLTCAAWLVGGFTVGRRSVETPAAELTAALARLRQETAALQADLNRLTAERTETPRLELERCRGGAR